MKAPLTEPDPDVVYDMKASEIDQRATLLTRDAFFDSVRETEIHKESEITV